MPFPTANDLAQALVRLNLLEPDRVEECLAQLGPMESAPGSLLRILESKAYLTPYQIGQLSRGETDGLVLGRYKLLYRNASGSFARVFRACSIEDGRMIGLKVLRQRWAEDARMVAQFRREAEVCRKLRHTNIVPIYEIGSDGDYHFFTMEFVEGGNLRDLLKIRKSLSPAEATRFVLDICRGLDYALRQGVTHRDMKMTNVLVNTRGVAKLVDFGLAGDQAGSDGDDESAQAVEYATLEKNTRAPADDPRSDLFFVGAIYYELLGGISPWPRTRSRDERKQFSRYANVPPLSSVAPGIPRTATEIVERLMTLNPNLRYQAPAEVIPDLQRVLAEVDENAEPGRAAPDNDIGGAQRTQPTVMCVESRVKRQDMLREYLSKHGFRVLVLSDATRALTRLNRTPPDAVILMGEALGESVVATFERIAGRASALPVAVLAVLSQQQADWADQLPQSETARILVQPVRLRDLRRQLRQALRCDDEGAIDEDS